MLSLRCLWSLACTPAHQQHVLSEQTTVAATEAKRLVQQLSHHLDLWVGSKEVLPQCINAALHQKMEQNLGLLVAWWPGRCRDHCHCIPALTSARDSTTRDMQGQDSKPDGIADVRSCLQSVTAIQIVLMMCRYTHNKARISKRTKEQLQCVPCLTGVLDVLTHSLPRSQHCRIRSTLGICALFCTACYKFSVSRCVVPTVALLVSVCCI